MKADEITLITGNYGCILSCPEHGEFISTDTSLTLEDLITAAAVHADQEHGSHVYYPSDSWCKL